MSCLIYYCLVLITALTLVVSYASFILVCFILDVVADKLVFPGLRRGKYFSKSLKKLNYAEHA